MKQFLRNDLEAKVFSVTTVPSSPIVIWFTDSCVNLMGSHDLTMRNRGNFAGLKSNEQISLSNLQT